MGRPGGPHLLLAVAAMLMAAFFEQMVRAADPAKGKAVFEQCAACHSLEGAGETDGPTLKGVFGRKAGTLEDFRYSAAMKRSGVTWDAATIDTYITDPQAFIPGNRMSFAGIADKAERDDLLAYLATATR